jgi:hypothetical protein
MRIGYARCVPGFQNELALTGGKNIDFGNLLIGSRNSAFEQAKIARDKPLDRRTLEKVAVVFDRDGARNLSVDGHA